jgi:hypothetical protein
MVPIGMGIASWGPVARQLGLLALALGDVDAALAHYATGVEVARRVRSDPWVAWCELELVDVETRCDRVSASTTERLRHATAIAAAPGLAHLRDLAAVLDARLA